MRIFNKKNIGERLEHISSQYFKTKSDFAEYLGMNPSNLYLYFKGERSPGSEILFKIQNLGCNINYLFDENEPIEKTEIKPNQKKIKAREIPVFGEVECGKPVAVWEHKIENIIMDKTGYLHNPFIMIAKGSSMEPYILPGDKILCHTENKKLKNGSLVIVSFKTMPESYEANAKLIRFENDGYVTLYSYNSEYYPPSIHKESEISNIYKVERIIRDV
jgi:SOS-response transcriptional repressor LexA